MQSSIHAFGHLCDIIRKYKLYNSSTPLQRFLTFSVTSQREREAGMMKGLTMAQWTNLNQNNRSVSTFIFCTVRKNGPILLLLVGRQAGRPQNVGEFQRFKIFLQVKLFGLLFCLLSLQCCYSIRTAF